MFGAITLVKNADIDKYKYLEYGIGFDSRGTFLFPDDSFAQNVVIFGADMSSFAHANSRTKDNSVLGKGLTQGLMVILQSQNGGLKEYVMKFLNLIMLLLHNQVH